MGAHPLWQFPVLLFVEQEYQRSLLSIIGMSLQSHTSRSCKSHDDDVTED